MGVWIFQSADGAYFLSGFANDAQTGKIKRVLNGDAEKRSKSKQGQDVRILHEYYVAFSHVQPSFGKSILGLSP